MRRRDLTFGLYADAEGLARVRSLVEDAAASRGARITTMSERPAADAYDFLASQWTVEHPGQNSGTRQPTELRVHLRCSLRTRRSLRKAVIEALCPEGPTPHTCDVPWAAT
ncbi:hypothetical protein ACFWWA_23715 [Streptomyces goshikiensis]|uniref:hypothetical protein n=1 Tax=Streptomyces goshikiensis TaxID=1942 RepID=UPI00364948C6